MTDDGGNHREQHGQKTKKKRETERLSERDRDRGCGITFQAMGPPPCWAGESGSLCGTPDRREDQRAWLVCLWLSTGVGCNFSWFFFSGAGFWSMQNGECH